MSLMFWKPVRILRYAGVMQTNYWILNIWHNTKILIINHQRSKALNNREKVNDKTVALAKKNGSLIVKTFTLLKMFEKYLNNELSKADCLRLINSNTGLLKI